MSRQEFSYTPLQAGWAQAGRQAGRRQAGRLGAGRQAERRQAGRLDADLKLVLQLTSFNM